MSRPRNTSQKGAAFERLVAHDLEDAGWSFVTRCSASKGGCDVVAITYDRVLFVECKTNGVLGPAQWNELWDLCQECDAEPVLAERLPGDRIRYWRLTGPKDGTTRTQPRDEWTP